MCKERLVVAAGLLALLLAVPVSAQKGKGSQPPPSEPKKPVDIVREPKKDPGGKGQQGGNRGGGNGEKGSKPGKGKGRPPNF